MTTNLICRAMSRDDLLPIERILDKVALFPSNMLSEMAEPFLSGAAPHIWIVISDRERLVGFVYCEAERMTDRTFNLLAIAVDPDVQRSGLGSALVEELSRHLTTEDGRILLVETSSLPEYGGTRAFYDRLGFTREARIREFYASGEDKIVFWRKL